MQLECDIAALDPLTQRLVQAASSYESPSLLINLAVVEAKFRALRDALSEAAIFYAVKANPHPRLVERLHRLGCAFDIASPGELELCRSVAGPAALLSYGNPIKKAAHIAEAAASGVDIFSVDSRQELLKVAAAAPGAQVTCRLAVSGTGAEWPLTHKFGCSADMAVALLCEARDLGLRPLGVSFHVGSQQTDPRAYAHAVGHAAQVFKAAAKRGVELEVLNLGGGLPATYSHATPPLGAYADAIRQALRQAFGANPPRLFIEPGRYLAADAGLMITEVVLSCERPHERVARFVYLDAGVWAGLDECMGERIKYRAFIADAGARVLAPAVLAGPTCDSADIIYRHEVMLPADLAPGERVLLLSAGAYTWPCSTVGFNGFPPLAVQVLEDG